MAFLHALRVSELVDLRWQQIDLDEELVYGDTPSRVYLLGGPDSQ
jgi:integrase